MSSVIVAEDTELARKLKDLHEHCRSKGYPYIICVQVAKDCRAMAWDTHPEDCHNEMRHAANILDPGPNTLRVSMEPGPGGS
jgi:predicted GNAT superfamily acetyltransferase